MNKVPWMWVIITALVTFFLGPRVMSTLSSK